MNYRLKIQYDGTNYAGWQIQENATTVQQKIVEAIKTITKEEINLIGSGRTDSGVHALGQVANFNIINKIDKFRFQYSLNGILPEDISIINIDEVDESFHSRFDAKKRSYIYLISKFKSPFFNKYSYFQNNLSDTKILNKFSELFTGKKDFTSFCRKNTETENKICEIYSIHWKEIKGLVIFFIEADRFLHGMVRTVAGTILKAAKNNFNEEKIKVIFEEKDREAAGEALPAKGLFLYKVKYVNVESIYQND